MSEKLEEIKANITGIFSYDTGEIDGVDISVDDYKWLVSRVEELEKDNKRLTDLNYHNNLPAMKSMYEEIERYKQALEFYADEYNWHEENTGSPYQPYYESDTSRDGGNVARKALEGEE